MPTKPKKCAHSIPASLRPHLKCPTLCPKCTLSRHISTLRSIESDFAGRGGVLGSKELVWKELGRLGAEGIESRKHIYLVRKWKRARLEIERFVWGFEMWEPEKEDHDDGNDDGRERSDKEKAIKDMLEAYESWLGGGDEKKSAQADAKGVDSDAGFLERSKTKYMRKRAERREARKSKNSTIDHICVKGIGKVMNGIRSGCSFASSNDKILRLDAYERIEDRRAKNVGFDEFVVVSPVCIISDPSGTQSMDDGDQDMPCESEIRAPHNAHTSTEQRRHCAFFCRRLPAYQPGPWASPPGYQKVNTSFVSMTWADVKKVWEDDNDEGKNAHQAKTKMETEKESFEIPVRASSLRQPVENVVKERGEKIKALTRSSVLSWTANVVREAL
ncbi:hypothetical protein CC78DRAFT_58142 [Lojkania enalia]|uniref:Uncharacterized protein n=1 Tax=Lojkania enalia TaxID=147567 RepID=A0A9P4K3N1_9PLEO|nr:hypothetical protein CC78DRAFT_58142 [Didymosphaeria enalia]